MKTIKEESETLPRSMKGGQPQWSFGTAMCRRRAILIRVAAKSFALKDYRKLTAPASSLAGGWSTLEKDNG